LQKRLQSLMLMGGDPKTVAKQAAQLAKEIGQAAKDYADASGQAAPAAAPVAADAEAATGGQGGEGTDAAQPHPQPQPQPAVVTSFSGPAAAARMKTSDDVIDSAKAMAASAKALIRSAQERARRQHKDGPEFGDAHAASDRADKDIAQAGKTLGVDDPFAGYTASGSSAPAGAGPAISVAV
jgi:hypothetical protein